MASAVSGRSVLSESEVHSKLGDALTIANNELAKTAEKTEVLCTSAFLRQDPSQYEAQLAIKALENAISINMLILNRRDKEQSPTDLAAQIVKKVENHLKAQKTNNIWISTTGSKFDARALPNPEQFKIADRECLIFNGRGLIYEQETVLQGYSVSSQTIVRLFEKNGFIWMLDDDDLAEQKGMRFNPSEVCKIAADCLEYDYSWKGKYHAVKVINMPSDVQESFRNLLAGVNP